MNRQDAKNAKDELDKFLDDLVHEVIGAVIEVHRELGPGFLEHVYEEALAVELALRELPFIRQKPVGVSYKQVSVGEGRLDMLVGGCLVLELKAVDRLLPIH
ncbi:MAG TPA: GxxExxY protein [Novimethylophilus sp.]|jgi:GxxExxY protein|uniref:GxxExxY protein n=1 Tax=Novimethylophilus sp. TaxID=2137426 RepID=UPI002F40DA3E